MFGWITLGLLPPNCIIYFYSNNRNRFKSYARMFFNIKNQSIRYSRLKVIKTLYKLYAIDLNLWNIICNKNSTQEVGKQLENIVLSNLYTKLIKFMFVLIITMRIIIKQSIWNVILYVKTLPNEFIYRLVKIFMTIRYFKEK
jgi:hypothetical protein